ncbi:hypothetical protein BT67DRAFT_434471 [Trichocladium antarcticum]|uniref:Uncharacterized protein n=1 Tax=Trichocladium antarcticum TaxID=1450529 RepID=A0AAN6UJF1_9PEZI|nr:hypothetical protein BT67DRAFT_434471 [Trichocladium antarcticum]
MDIALYIITSDAGGLPKAKIGLLYYIPVKTVIGKRYPNGDYILRSILVIASNAGGLPKAKIGLLYYIPVKTITGERYPNGDYILRGILVIASDSGGLPKAKIGLPYYIPVKTITGERYPNGDYIVVNQDITLWEEALTKQILPFYGIFEEEGYASKTWYRTFEKEGIFEKEGTS